MSPHRHKRNSLHGISQALLFHTIAQHHCTTPLFCTTTPLVLSVVTDSVSFYLSTLVTFEFVRQPWFIGFCTPLCFSLSMIIFQVTSSLEQQ